MDSSIDRNLWGLAISRSVASVPSIVGSAFIIQHILRRRGRHRRRHPQQQQRQGRQLVTGNRIRRRRDDGRRIGSSSSSSSLQRDNIMLGMCTMDFVYSLINVCSSVPVPSQLSSVYKFAVGNWTTCEVFGFVGQFTSMSSVLYNGSLTIYYFLTIRNDRQRRGRTQRTSQSNIMTIQGCNVFELLMHFIPILVGLTTAIIALPLDLYNPTPTSCTIVSFPLNCDNDNLNSNRADETEQMMDGSDSTPSAIPSSCIRGGNARALFIPLVSVWVWTTFFLMVIAMTMIYVKIEQTARTPTFTSRPSRLVSSSPSALISNAFRRPPSNDSIPNSNESELNVNSSIINTSSNSSKKLLSLKRQFATQALLYCVVFAITWLPGLLIRRLYAWFELQPGFGIAYVSAILVPLQGFWNAFVYIRPTYLRYRRRQREQQQQQLLQEREEELPENVGERSDISRGRAHDVVVENRSRVQALVQALSVNDDAADDDNEDDDDDDDSMDKNDEGQE